jgi:hypothetical protein
MESKEELGNSSRSVAADLCAWSGEPDIYSQVHDVLFLSTCTAFVCIGQVATAAYAIKVSCGPFIAGYGAEVCLVSTT